jgi:hypothetical protein
MENANGSVPVSPHTWQPSPHNRYYRNALRKLFFHSKCFEQEHLCSQHTKDYVMLQTSSYILQSILAAQTNAKHIITQTAEAHCCKPDPLLTTKIIY